MLGFLLFLNDFLGAVLERKFFIFYAILAIAGLLIWDGSGIFIEG